MNEPLTCIIHSIKCDHCSWRDDTVPFEEYPSYLNKPCPHCGANLLTEKDYNKAKRILRFVAILNKIFGPKRHKNSGQRTVQNNQENIIQITMDFPHQK